jgi:hypothetical protein
LLVGNHPLVGDLGLQRERAFGVTDRAVGRPDPGGGLGAELGAGGQLELAWSYLRLHPIEEARRVMIAAIGHIARRHGADGKYHATITVAWLRCVAVHMQRWGAGSFEEFIERNPDLLDGKLLEHFYSREVIVGEAARSGWVGPDLRALPTLA